MLKSEIIQATVLQFTRGKMGFVASDYELALAIQPPHPPDLQNQVDSGGLLTFLQELPDLTAEWGTPEWIGIEYTGESLFVHPRKDIRVGVWMEGGLEKFAPFQAFVRERMDDLVSVIRSKLLQDFEEVLHCVRFLVTRLEGRWGKILVRWVFWTSLAPLTRTLLRNPRTVHERDLTRKDLEQALTEGLHRFVKRLERTWGREPVRREIDRVLSHPHPDRPTGCVRERLQKFLPRL